MKIQFLIAGLVVGLVVLGTLGYSMTTLNVSPYIQVEEVEGARIIADIVTLDCGEVKVDKYYYCISECYETSSSFNANVIPNNMYVSFNGMTITEEKEIEGEEKVVCSSNYLYFVPAPEIKIQLYDADERNIEIYNPNVDDNSFFVNYYITDYFPFSYVINVVDFDGNEIEGLKIESGKLVCIKYDDDGNCIEYKTNYYDAGGSMQWLKANVTVDGNYKVKLTATDNYGRSSIEEVSFTIKRLPGISASSSVNEKSATITAKITNPEKLGEGESIVCKYANAADSEDYFNMTTADGLTHTASFNNLENGNYKKYIACTYMGACEESIKGLCEPLTGRASTGFTINYIAPQLPEDMGRISTYAIAMQIGSNSLTVFNKDTVNFEINSEKHSMYIDNIVNSDVSGKFVEITISSDPVTVQVNLGEKKEIDIDGDGANDMSIELKELYGNVKADLEVILLEKTQSTGAETTNENIEESTGETKETISEPTGLFGLIGENMYIFGILVFAVCAVLAFKFKDKLF